MNEQHLDESFGTLSETINGLIKRGYTHDFNIKDECLVCHKSDSVLSPDDFHIDKVYRFEGASDPDYQSILYAISSVKFGIKGVLVNGYGIFSDEATSRLIEKLQTNTPGNGVDARSNEATPLRPEGNRVINAPLVEMDLNKFIAQIRSEITWKESDRNAITIFKSDTLRIVLMGLRANAELKQHTTNGVLSLQVVEGRVYFITDRQNVQLEKGQMIALQENIRHNVVALSESFVLLTLAMKSK